MNVTLVDRLLRAILRPDEFPMTPELERYHSRLKQARAYLLDYPTSVSVDLMLNLYKNSEKGYSRSTAYNDVNAAKTFFGAVETANKEFDRIIQIQRLEQARRMAEHLAKSTKDYLAVAKIDFMIAQIKQLDKKDDSIDTSKITPPAVNILIATTDGRSLEALTGKEVKREVIDLIEGDGFSVEDIAEQLKIMEKQRNPNNDDTGTKHNTAE